MNVPESLDGQRAPHDLRDLFARVDQACTGAEGERLAQAVHVLGLCVSPPEQLDLLEIERLAFLDVGKASFLWTCIRPGLRHKLFEWDGDHDTGEDA